MSLAASQNPRASPAARAFVVALTVVSGFSAISVQLVRLALRGQFAEPRVAMPQPLTTAVWRPDIIDRNGRLLATDIEAPTLYADPAMIIDVDEVVERLTEVFP